MMVTFHPPAKVAVSQLTEHVSKLDVTEELGHVAVGKPDISHVKDYLTILQACKEHEVLAEVLRLDIEPSTLEPRNVRQKNLAQQLRKAIDTDPAQAPAMIEMLKTYLSTFDNLDDDFARMEEYMPYRIANCGYW